jgi:hypothetical protein
MTAEKDEKPPETAEPPEPTEVPDFEIIVELPPEPEKRGRDFDLPDEDT